MLLNFTSDENQIVSSIQAMIEHRMPGKHLRLTGVNQKEMAQLHEASVARTQTFLSDWAMLVVFLRDVHGFKLDLYQARKLVEWERLNELCDPQTLIGRSLQARLMRKYLHPVPIQGVDACKLAFVYETMTLARVLQSAIDVPTYPENWRWRARDEDEGDADE